MRSAASIKFIRTAVALLVTAVLAASLVGCSGGSGGGSKSEPGSKPQTSKPSSSWSAVTVLDGSVFFGKRVDVGDSSVVFLNDAYFIAKGGDTADVNTLRRFGNEVHKPVAAVEVPRTSVLYLQSLVESSPVVAAIKKFEAEKPAEKVNAVLAVPTIPYAVFLKDGQVVFGPITIADRTLTVSDAYYLSFKDKSKAALGEIQSLDDVTLVPQNRTVVAPTGAMEIPLESVLYFQPLAKDSPVVKALGK